MGGDNHSRAGQPRIDAAAKAAFIRALRCGTRREAAAAAAGFTLQGFYGARRRDPAFAAAWVEALAASAAAERCPAPDEGPGETRIAPNNRRGLQRRRMRNVRFDERRRQLFLACFAWSCDTRAAAAHAGVSESTVSLHRRTDPAFAAEFREALDHGYDLLEAEALRQRLEAQRRLRAAMDRSAAGDAPPVAPDMAAEFERVLKLLARWDRKRRAPDRQAQPDGRRKVWTFDSAIELLDKRLKALGVEALPLPSQEAARYDGSP